MILTRRQIGRLLGQGVRGWIGLATLGILAPASALETFRSEAPAGLDRGDRDRPSYRLAAELLRHIDSDPGRRAGFRSLGTACRCSGITPAPPAASGLPSDDEGRRRMLEQKLRRGLATERTELGTPDAHRLFREAVRRDFAEGDCVEVSGWFLSRTEACTGVLIATRGAAEAPSRQPTPPT